MGVVVSACATCSDTGLAEAPIWRWQADRWKPCLNGCQPPSLKRRTTYECLTPGCGKTTVWTGDLGAGRRPGDHLCRSCSVPLTELVLDGSRYKVEWEMRSLHGGVWGVSCRETESRKSADDQYAQLREWERTGEQDVRNVKLYRSHVTWERIS